MQAVMKLDEKVKFSKFGTAFTTPKGNVIKPLKRLCNPCASYLAMRLVICMN